VRQSILEEEEITDLEPGGRSGDKKKKFTTNILAWRLPVAYIFENPIRGGRETAG